MYHLFETEMRSISAFNGEALRWFSIGSLCLNCIIAIVIGWGYTDAPLSDFAAFMVHKAVWFIGAITIASFGFGIWALCQKKNMIDQIKAETRAESV